MSDTSRSWRQIHRRPLPHRVKDEAEKSLMWFYDDLHCPNPISPLYFDIGGWWDCDGRWGADCTYMYQRFGARSARPDRQEDRRLCLLRRGPPEMDADKVGPMFDYYTKVMPIYADTFMDAGRRSMFPVCSRSRPRSWTSTLRTSPCLKS